MLRHKIDDFAVSLSAFSVTRLHSKLQVSGLLLPYRHANEPLLALGDGQSLVVIPLEGPRAFRWSSLQVGTTVDGILFQEIQIAVNVGSRLNSRAHGHLGDISIAEGRVQLLSIDSRSGWEDAEPFVLPFEVSMSSEDPVGFREWSILMDYRGSELELWRRRLVPAA